ncbi:MAG: hypothetical protein RR540_05160 [Oscillospiraceae bacterium]
MEDGKKNICKSPDYKGAIDENSWVNKIALPISIVIFFLVILLVPFSIERYNHDKTAVYSAISYKLIVSQQPDTKKNSKEIIWFPKNFNEKDINK